MDFKIEIEKLMGCHFDPDKDITEQNNILAEIKESIIKLGKGQKESAINLEEIQSLIEDSYNSQSDILNTLIYAIDYIEDFYSFAESDKESALFIQAEMMLNGILKKASSIGVTKIYDIHTEFNPDVNTIEYTEENPALQNGIITKTLRCGYVYNGEIIRKSKVVVVKN